MNSQFTTFSILLGLTDFVNPVFYTLFFVVMMKNLKDRTDSVMFNVFKAGAIISLTGGFVIPLGKVIVGLGLVKFVMPVPVVHFVNTGFLVSGVTLFLICLGKKYSDVPVWLDVLFVLIYAAGFGLICVFSKYNTAAVLTGVIGIVLIYVSMVIMSCKAGKVVPAVLAVLSFCLTVFLAGVGTRKNLYSVGVHWVIELTNIVCQCSLFLSAVFLFRKKKDA